MFTIFAEMLQFGWVLNVTLGNTVKTTTIKKSYLTFMQNFLYQHSCYVMHNLFCSTKQKNVLQKDPLSISWVYLWAWLFHQRDRIWIAFAGLKFAQTQWNNCDLPKVGKNKQVGSILTCPKLDNFEQLTVRKWPVWKSISSHGEARNKILTPCKSHSKHSIGYSAPQEVLTPLPHIYMTLTNLFISTVIKLL